MSEPTEILESKWITVHGLSLHYRASIGVPSSNTAVVMVHGLVVSSRYMLPTARCLAPYYRVYIPDLPGYGKSGKPAGFLTIAEYADVLADWMDAIGLEEAILVGNSLGCQIIAQFALRHKERLRGAVLVGPTMDPQARTATWQILRWLVNLVFEPPPLYLVVLRDFIDIGFRRFAATFRYGLQDHIEEHLPEMRMPTLVVRGARDTIVPQRWAEAAADLLSEGQLVLVPKAAHDVNYNSPVQLANIVRVFVTSLPAHREGKPGLQR